MAVTYPAKETACCSPSRPLSESVCDWKPVFQVIIFRTPGEVRQPLPRGRPSVSSSQARVAAIQAASPRLSHSGKAACRTHSFPQAMTPRTTASFWRKLWASPTKKGGEGKREERRPRKRNALCSSLCVRDNF